MKWSDPIPLDRALRDVRLLAQAPAQDWQEHLREREQTAFERGRRAGEQALSEQLLQQRQETADLQQGILESLRRVVPRVSQEAETALIQLALEAAQKIVAGLPISLALVENIVREALQQVDDPAKIVTQLPPEDLLLRRKPIPPLLNGLPEPAPPRSAGSAEVGRGGCLAQPRFGLVDARRETKLEQLRESLAQ
jgi:flagellar biosynthesis/type III secretory pathway protein FliH